MTLTNIMCVPGMLINIVAARRLKQAGYTWDFDNNTIREGKRTLFKLKDYSSGLWVVKQPKDDDYVFAAQRPANCCFRKAVWTFGIGEWVILISMCLSTYLKLSRVLRSLILMLITAANLHARHAR